MGELKNREHYTTTIPKEQIKTIDELAKRTHIAKSKLAEEAYDDLFIKYGINKKEILPDKK